MSNELHTFVGSLHRPRESLDGLGYPLHADEYPGTTEPAS